MANKIKYNLCKFFFFAIWKWSQKKQKFDNCKNNWMYCIVLMNLIMSMTLLLSFMYTRSSPEWSPSYTTPATGGDWSTMMGESEIPMVLRSTVNRIKHIIRMVKLSFNNKWSDKTRKYCYSTIMYFKMHSVDCFELVKYWFKHSNCGIKHCINSICVLVNAQTCKCSFHALQFTIYYKTLVYRYWQPWVWSTQGLRWWSGAAVWCWGWSQWASTSTHHSHA